MAPAERKALLFLAAVFALGAGYRASRAGGRPLTDASSRAALEAQIGAVDSARSADRDGKPRRRSLGSSRTGALRTGGSREEPSKSSSPPPRESSTESAYRPSPVTSRLMDIDQATARDLESLPGIGPALAARIVTDRDSAGPFGSLAGFGRVRGIGPALLAKLERQVTFSGTPRPSNSVSNGAPVSSRAARGRRRSRP